MADEAEVEQALLEALIETDLTSFQSKLIFDKQLTRIDHFTDVTDAELKSYGLSEPAIRRLRNAIDRRRKKRAKIFGGTKREKTVRVKRDECSYVMQQNGSEFSSQPYLISKNEIKLLETLGEGNFSIVKRALWTRPDGSKVDCAVKILREMSEGARQDLTAEISTMQQLRHPNLVQLFGVLFAEQFFIVIEFCDGGSLLNRLRDQNKPRLLITTLLNYSQQIANGMGYLESRKCLHRDLAARNVLLANEEQRIKICDFGLTRLLNENEHLYVMHEPKKIPFSWSAPESLRFREFSHKSDVWAFGVTIWELYTFGEEPWAGCRAAEVLSSLESGQRLRRPEFCPQEIYDIMQMCWNKNAEERPKFSQLRNLLTDIKFMTMACSIHNNNSSNEANKLQLSVGDEVILIGETQNSNEWIGQCKKTRQFGTFPRSCVSLENASQTQQSTLNDCYHQRTDISHPLAGSFIHTGHGDLDERRCWGHVDHIEYIYLKNPLVNTSNSISNSDQKFTIVPSILMLNQKGGSAPSSMHNSSFTEIEETTKQVNQYLPPELKSVYPKKTCESSTTTSSRSSVSPSLRELQHQSAAFEWIAGELVQLSNSKRNSSVMEQNEQQNIPFQREPFGVSENVVAKSKYNKAIAIPRPTGRTFHQTNRLTPPPISVGNFVAGSSAPSSMEHRLSSVSSMPSVCPIQSSSQIGHMKSDLPTSTHSLNRESSSKDDPFVVKDDVKTLSVNFRYNDVHKISAFTSILSPPSSSTTESTQNEQLQQACNVAVVLPLQQKTQNTQQINKNKFTTKGRIDTILPSPINHFTVNNSVESLLPPPSDLLLSGFETASTPSTSDSQCKPLFDISDRYSLCRSNQSMNSTSVQRARIQYGTNGIPILEPIPATSANLYTKFNNVSTNLQNVRTEESILALSALDTDAILNKVKGNVDFASLEQCRQVLWRTGFDAESAIKQLKIEKLIEMGLASDRDLAASALDTEQWDINAAANRLCC